MSDGRSRIWPSGKEALKSDHEVIETGRNSSCVAACVPIKPVPVICCQSVSVWRSYMIRSLFCRNPDTPNSSTVPPGRVRGKTSEVLQRGQKVTRTGSPLMTSFTISWEVMIDSG